MTAEISVDEAPLNFRNGLPQDVVVDIGLACERPNTFVLKIRIRPQRCASSQYLTLSVTYCKKCRPFIRLETYGNCRCRVVVMPGSSQVRPVSTARLEARISAELHAMLKRTAELQSRCRAPQNLAKELGFREMTGRRRRRA